MTGPRFFSKWASLSKPYMVNIDSFSAWNGQEQTQYIITTSDHVLTGSVSIYKITREGPRHSQTMMIPGAKTTKNININNTVYIAVACNNYYDDDDTKRESQLYTWTFDDDNEGSLTHVQTFNDNQADDITFGTTTSDIFITLTTNNERSRTGLPSKIYKWDPEHHQFHFIQSLDTIRGIKPNFFNAKEHLWLTIACQYNTSIILNSFIYRWNGSRFELFQTLPSPQTTKDLHPVNIGNSVFLVAANFLGPVVVYRMSEFTGHFEVFQTLPTSKVVSIDSFTIKSEYFIAVSSWESSVDLSTSDTKLIIYKFSGATYNSFQEITTEYAPSVKVFRDVFTGSRLMGIANTRSIDLYKWNDASNNFA